MAPHKLKGGKVRKHTWAGRFLVPIASLLFLQPNIEAQRLSSNQRLSSKMDDLVGAYVRLDRFSGTVLVARNGKVLFAKGYGRANLDFDFPNTVHTKFDIGSIAKTFMGVAIMQLVREGKLDLQQPIIKYLPDYPAAQSDLVTVHHLLTHTSGIPSLDRIGDGLDDIEAGVHPYSTQDLLNLFKDKKLLFAPGSQVRYSNSGFIVLAAIIERVSGVPFEDYLRAHIFEPVHMNDTVVRRSEEALRNRATGYDGFGNSKFNAQYAHPSWDLGGGGIYSTVVDMLKWDQALYGSDLLPAEYKEKLFKPYVKSGFAGPAEAYFGYGWELGEVLGRKVLAHYGGSNGFEAAFFRFPEDRTTVIVLSNYRPSAPFKVHDEIIMKLSSILYGQNYDLPPVVKAIPSVVLSRYVGEYELAPGFNLSVSLKDGELWAQVNGKESWTLFNYWGEQKKALSASEFSTRTQALFELLSRQDFTGAATFFGQGAIETQPQQLSSLWKALLELGGSGKRISVVNLRSLPGRTLVTTRIDFEKTALIFNIAYNDKKQIISFTHLAGPPSGVRLHPTAANEFFVDGFPYRLRDVFLKATRNEKTGMPQLVLRQDQDVIMTKIK